MNTKQLIAIWYTGLAIDIVLLIQAVDKENSWLVVIALAVLGLLFVLSFRPYNNVKKKVVLSWVGIPILLCSVAATIGVYHNQSMSKLPIDQQNKVEGKASITPNGQLEVTLYNGSSWRIKKVQVAISVIESNGKKADERIYELTKVSSYNYGDGLPYKNTRYDTELGYSLAPWEFEWHIKTLMGTPQ